MIINKVRKHYVVHRGSSALYVINKVSLGVLLHRVFKLDKQLTEDVLSIIDLTSWVDINAEKASSSSYRKRGVS